MTDVSSLGDASDWKEGILEGESGQEKEKKIIMFITNSPSLESSVLWKHWEIEMVSNLPPGQIPNVYKSTA